MCVLAWSQLRMLVRINYSLYKPNDPNESLLPTSSVRVMMASSSYFNQFLNGKPTLAELCEHVRINTKWYKFGVLLELDTTKLDGIEQQYKESDVKAVKMFELWLSSKPKAMRREIIATLRKDAIGENTIAEQYQSVLKESELKKLVDFDMSLPSPK